MKVFAVEGLSKRITVSDAYVVYTRPQNMENLWQTEKFGVLIYQRKIFLFKTFHSGMDGWMDGRRVVQSQIDCSFEKLFRVRDVDQFYLLFKALEFFSRKEQQIIFEN